MPSNPGLPGAAVPHGLDAWVARLRDQEMPVFGATASAIGAVTECDRTSAGALGRVVLQDAGMTARVLKLANSSYFNPRGAAVGTVSRAIVLLGFETVQSVALSVALVESLAHGSSRKRVAEMMARSLHAAVQARHLAKRRGDGAAEEVFIAALLANLGEMAFWCFAGETGERLQALQDAGLDGEDAEMSVLGFRLKQLTVAMAREWKLSPMVSGVTQGNFVRGSREQGVFLAHRLAQVVEQGWETPTARAALRELADHAGVDAAELQEEIHRNAAEAARIARFYGAAEAARLIPVPAANAEAGEDEVTDDGGPRQPDASVQLEVSREMSAHIAQAPQFNALLDMALEGIYRGLATDRALFALVTPNRQQLLGKAALGENAQQLQQKFQFLLTGVPRDVIVEALERRKPYLVVPGQEGLPPFGRLYNAVGARPCMVAPVGLPGNVLGLLYADRAAGLDAEDFDGLCHFARLVGLGLEVLAARSGRR